VLAHNSLFISSPLDLNDPFETRPAWTQEHEDREWEFRNWRNKMSSGLPLLIVTREGLVPGGVMLDHGEEPRMQVEHQVGIADTYNHSSSNSSMEISGC
jgi:hypothetical protein